MATVSNAGAGMSFSNAQQGTRGMSASDWIRLKRLKGAVNNDYGANGLLKPSSPNFNKDIAPPTNNQLNIHNSNGAIRVYPVVGTSKIRRPASNWTDYIASQTADYITSSQAATTGTSIKNVINKICTCATSTLLTKQGICTKCNGTTTHVRIM